MKMFQCKICANTFYAKDCLKHLMQNHNFTDAEVDNIFWNGGIKDYFYNVSPKKESMKVWDMVEKICEDGENELNNWDDFKYATLYGFLKGILLGMPDTKENREALEIHMRK